MRPEHEALLIVTRQQFPALADVACEVDPIVKGGSDRRYYRLLWAGDAHPPMVLMVYTLARRDNPKFVPATIRLAKLGVHVPKVYAFDAERLFVWLEDLGNIDLHSRAGEPPEVRAPLYETALREVAKIHAVREADLTDADKAALR